MQNYFLKKAKTLVYACLFLLISVIGISGQSMFKKILDFDGDGRADFAVVRRENNLKYWYIWQSTAGFRAVQWGLPLDYTQQGAGDFNATGDYDGDGKTDVAVYRLVYTSSNSLRHDYYILQSGDNSFASKSITTIRANFHFGSQQDYDGDGKTDPTAGFFYDTQGGESILLSSTNSLRTLSYNYQSPIRVGDMDGDGTAEHASRNTNNNVVTWTNLMNGNSHSIQFGLSSDRTLPADFDGDGKGDLTVWRPSEGNWYWLRSSDNAFQAIQWGLETDIPVPADYDGDGKTDQAVYRRGSPNGVYYINGSLSGFHAFVWGISTDNPVTY
jgi:hypothetical protein